MSLRHRVICGSRVQPSLLGEERHERTAEIEPKQDLEVVKIQAVDRATKIDQIEDEMKVRL